MFKIKQAVIESILEASKNSFPNEFFAYLGGDKKTQIIDELIIVPATQGNGFVMIKEYLVPIDTRLIGSIHSHPSRNALPSKADIRSFSSRGMLHLIVSLPYDLNSIKAYDFNGKKTEFEIISD